MCTVTFIPVRDTFVITSNRDEKNSRIPARPPAIYEYESGKLIYPQDGQAGGSWIAMHENGNAAVLLNGAFEKHVSTPPYRLSRGNIFLAIISSVRPARRFDRLDLQDIEPFTLVLLDEGDLYECRWDGRKKHCRQLRNYRPYIWSSVTLYSPQIMTRREHWFASFLNRFSSPTQDDILRFHQFSGDGDKSNSLQMEREGRYSTISVTSMMLTNHRGSMKYIDLVSKTDFEKKIEFLSDFELT